jgi:AcrR family transcriptional regulator
MSPSTVRGPRWERRKESRPAELLAAALELFVERGYAATRLDEVAARAGVSKGTLYLYFEGKEELFKAVVRDTIVPRIDEMRRGAEQSSLGSAELLRAFLVDWWEHFGASRLGGLAKLIVAEAGNFPEVARFFHDEVIEPHAEVLVSIIERGIRRGEFAPVDARVAAHLWIAPLALKAIWTHSMDALCPPELRVAPDRLLRTHIDFVLAALRPAPAATGAAS